MAEDNIPSLRTSDVIVLVMGLTGVGKSSFIEKLTGEDAGAGHSLQSATTGIGFYCFTASNRRVFIVDTPGFDDTRSLDTTAFQEIAFFLRQVHVTGATLGGVIYLHRITDNRMSGSAMRSITLIKKMCGFEAAKFTTCVTTMWDTLHVDGRDYDKACQREVELRTTEEYWGSMVDQSSCMQRWDGTRASALPILHRLLWLSDNHGRVVLQIQTELVDGQMDLDETSAGIELAKHYGVKYQRLQRDLDPLRLLQEHAINAQDTVSVRYLEEKQKDLERRLEMTEMAERDLRDDVQTLFTEKTRKYRELFFNAQRELKQLSGKEKELQSQLIELEGTAVYQVVAPEADESPKTGERTAQGGVLKGRRSQKREKRQKNQSQETVEQALDKVQKRKLFKENILSILGMLGMWRGDYRSRGRCNEDEQCSSGGDLAWYDGRDIGPFEKE